MSMVFEDRISTYPNRYAMTDENGSVSHVILERADEPTIPGTPLNAETFNEAFGEKAPAGFGLGDQARAMLDMDKATKSGFYALAGDSCTNYPTEYPNFRYGTVLVENRYDSLVKQTFFYGGYSAIRYGSWDKDAESLAWSSVEFVNPPLEVGKTYRTTERSEGKPVYVKRISVTCDKDISALSAGANIYFEHGISNFGRLVRCNAVMDSAYPLPHISHRNNGSASIITINNVNTTNIAVTAINIDRAAPSFVFDIAYCKA